MHELETPFGQLSAFYSAGIHIATVLLATLRVINQQNQGHVFSLRLMRYHTWLVVPCRFGTQTIAARLSLLAYIVEEAKSRTRMAMTDCIVKPV